MEPDFEKAMGLIDAAHAQDPNIITITPNKNASPLPPSSSPSPPSSSPETIPYELHYARKMTSYLHLHLQGSERSPSPATSTTPNPSPYLSLAVRAQHLRRWEIPRSSYPEGKAGYFAWRTMLKKRQAELVRSICLQCGYGEDGAERVARLVGKVGLKKKKEGKGQDLQEGKEEGEGEEDEGDEVQILEDVACLVFLDDQFEAFERGHDEDKMLGILSKTWAKMGGRGRELALGIQMSGRCRELVERAVAG
jgi:Domain of unknown function (DUF4202)